MFYIINRIIFDLLYKQALTATANYPRNSGSGNRAPRHNHKYFSSSLSQSGYQQQQRAFRLMEIGHNPTHDLKLIARSDNDPGSRHQFIRLMPVQVIQNILQSLARRQLVIHFIIGIHCCTISSSAVASGFEANVTPI